MSNDITPKRKADSLPLTDKLKIIRGLITAFDGKISYDSGAGLITGRFESADNAQKVHGLIGQLLLDANIRMTVDRTLDIKP